MTPTMTPQMTPQMAPMMSMPTPSQMSNASTPTMHSMQMMMQQIKPQIDQIAAVMIADMVESMAQAVEPPQQSDPLVDIRNQELQLKAADMQRKSSEFEAKQELEREKEKNDVLVNQQRIDVSEAALDDKTRIAEDRIRTQREIAVMNATKANTG